MHFHLPKPLHGWRAFVGEAGIFCTALLVVVAAIMRLLKLRDEEPSPTLPRTAATV